MPIVFIMDMLLIMFFISPIIGMPPPAPPLPPITPPCGALAAGGFAGTAGSVGAALAPSWEC
jgi:hypothetical protein